MEAVAALDGAAGRPVGTYAPNGIRRRGLAIAHGMDLTRDLGNLPGNICTPTYLAERAQALAKELDFSCQVLDRPQLEELKMGSFLSVTNGSDEHAAFWRAHAGGKVSLKDA